MGKTTRARNYFKGMGSAVADRTINRKVTKKGVERRETWAEVAERVSLGNSLLEPRLEFRADEKSRMNHHMRQASLLMSGRHLQHGDETQPTRNMEIFTNCATSATTFLLFYLLLNGSGVGRSYDDLLIKADFNKMPIVVPVVDITHPDVTAGKISGFIDLRLAKHRYAFRKVTVFRVPDSREGWAKAIEIIERMTFEEKRDEVLILDFTDIRPYGSPIHGMQNRPASGPAPLMSAIAAISTLREAGMPAWRAAMYADHYVAECVLVGGARRAARMATKHWKDASIFDFISLKRGGFLWSSNNSVMADQEFRDACVKVHALVRNEKEYKASLETLLLDGIITTIEAHAYRVLRELTEAAYYDKTGEPGIINLDKLTDNTTGIEQYVDGLFAESVKFQVDEETKPFMQSLANEAIGMGYHMITNPCGEITLLLLGGYCVIADVVPFYAKNDDDAEDAFRTAVRALIRTNLMDCLYSREVKRTNRIGVGMTGLHEWIYDRFEFTWRDIVNEEKSLPMWLMLSRFKRAIVDEAKTYSAILGVVAPHTDTTQKPAGTTSKLFGLTEGAHLPAMREYIRWVQFRNDDPLVEEYASKGYPIKQLASYEGTTVVGFPTKPAICNLDGGEWVVTASEATPEEQYEFLRLLEKYWLTGVEEDGVTPLVESGNQISYTLKYDPKIIDYNHFLNTLINGQFNIRCCSVMPQEDTSAYEYLPEEAVSSAEFKLIAGAITDTDVKEDIGLEHVDCGTGGCPIDFNDE